MPVDKIPGVWRHRTFLQSHEKLRDCAAMLLGFDLITSTQYEQIKKKIERRFNAAVVALDEKR